MQRLSNDQVAERVRAANRRRSERQRARRMEAGKMAFTVWIPANLQRQIVELATAESATTSAVAERLLIAGINALAEPPRPSPPVDASNAPESLPLFEPATTETAPPLTCINADLNSLVEGGSVRGEPAKPAPGTPAERDAAIVALRRQGKSLGQIAAVLAERGILTSKGNPLSRDTVNQVVKRAGLTAAHCAE